MFILPSLAFLAVVSAAVSSKNKSRFEKTFIVELASPSNSKLSVWNAGDHVATFRKRAASLDYSVRHEFHNSDVFLGVSIQVNGNQTKENVLQELQNIGGVISVSDVSPARIPVQQGSVKNDLYASYSHPLPLTQVASASTAKLGSALRMGDVDQLHKRGIKGKGIKIGIVDTGVDYRHPALGAGFGPGHKIAGGYSFVYDNGTLGEGPDPFISCYGGGHGTHVAGLWLFLLKELG